MVLFWINPLGTGICCDGVYPDRSATTNNEETHLQDFLGILKRLLQNISEYFLSIICRVIYVEGSIFSNTQQCVARRIMFHIERIQTVTCSLLNNYYK